MVCLWLWLSGYNTKSHLENGHSTLPIFSFPPSSPFKITRKLLYSQCFGQQSFCRRYNTLLKFQWCLTHSKCFINGRWMEYLCPLPLKFRHCPGWLELLHGHELSLRPFNNSFSMSRLFPSSLGFVISQNCSTTSKSDNKALAADCNSFFMNYYIQLLCALSLSVLSPLS